MQIPISHPAFKAKQLVVETAGFFRGPRLLVNGAPAKRAKGRYAVITDAGNELVLELKHNFLDPIPKVKIGEELIELARSLTWYEYLWIGIPIVLLFIGGGLGALVGISAVYLSARVFRADLNPFAKYGFTGLISLASGVVFVVLAAVVQLLIGAPQQ
jgi:hypothetical protein